jgi:SAM-dependent methyltransferase
MDMTQVWDPHLYGVNGAFVHQMAGGVLEWLAPRDGEAILDLGCGDGQLTQRIAASGARVVGVDASAEMAEAARARGVQASVADAAALPFEDAAFDAVFSNAVLHWVRDQDGMMGEVRRVLRPGGRFVAEMGGHGNIAAIHVALKAVLARHGYEEREMGVNYYPTAEAYTRRLERHGFRIAQMALIPRPTPLPGGMEGWLGRRWLRRRRSCWHRHCGTRMGTGLPTMCGCGLLPQLERAFCVFKRAHFIQLGRCGCV